MACQNTILNLVNRYYIYMASLKGNNCASIKEIDGKNNDTMINGLEVKKLNIRP